MRERRVLRFYCDHCSQSAGRRNAMEKHERGCTKNPARVCGMCIAASGAPSQYTVQQLAEILGDGSPERMKELRRATDNCPACILAAIRVGKCTWWSSNLNESFDGSYVEFDFKKEAAAFWNEVNAANDERREP